MRMTQQHVAQRPQVGAGIGGAGRVAGRVHDQPLGPGRDRALEILGLQLEALRFRALHDDRRAVAEQHHLRIGHPVGRRHDHLVAGVQGRQHGVEDDLLAARRDDGLRRLVVEAMVALHLGADRLAQRRRAGHRGVAGVVGVDGLDGRFLDVVGRREVGLAGGQADHVFAGRFHLQELALGGIGRRGLDAAETIGNESHDAILPFRPRRGARKYWQAAIFARQRDVAKPSRGLFLVSSRRTRVMPQPTSVTSASTLILASPKPTRRPLTGAASR